MAFRQHALPALLAGILALAVAAPASAAPKPNMHLTWTKVERAWMAAARKHGAKMDCPTTGTDWSGGGKIVCTLTAGASTWTADFQFFGPPTFCQISMSFVDTANRRLLGIQRLSPCEKRWWLKIASVWTYPAAQERPMVR